MAYAVTYILLVFLGAIVFAIVRMKRAERARRAAMSPEERAEEDRESEAAMRGW